MLRTLRCAALRERSYWPEIRWLSGCDSFPEPRAKWLKTTVFFGVGRAPPVQFTVYKKGPMPSAYHVNSAEIHIRSVAYGSRAHRPIYRDAGASVNHLRSLAAI